MDKRQRFSGWWPFLWAVFVRPLWWWLVTTPLFILTGLQVTRAELVPTNKQAQWALLSILPSWDWKTWLLLALALTIVIILVSAYRIVVHIQEGDHGGNQEHVPPPAIVGKDIKGTTLKNVIVKTPGTGLSVEHSEDLDIEGYTHEDTSKQRLPTEGA